MRLNGKAAILGYLGKSDQSSRTWYSLLLRYGNVIRVNYYRIRRGMRGYWCRSEDLDAVDRELSITAWEAHGKENLVAYVTTQQVRCRNARRRGAIR